MGVRVVLVVSGSMVWGTVGSAHNGARKGHFVNRQRKGDGGGLMERRLLRALSP